MQGSVEERRQAEKAVMRRRSQKESPFIAWLEVDLLDLKMSAGSLEDVP